MNVKLIRMHSGEDVVADLIKEQASDELMISKQPNCFGSWT